MARQPVYFVSHGSPMSMFEPESAPFRHWVKLGAEVKRLDLRAIVFVSAHWESESDAILVTSQERNELLFDYYGYVAEPRYAPLTRSSFPQKFYDVKFASPGSPSVASRVLDLLRSAHIKAATAQRGLDHGVFVPLRTMLGDSTDIPIVQISLPQSSDPNQAMALGQALKPLRDEDVLIIGGGMSVHNMRDCASDFLSRVSLTATVRRTFGSLEPLPYARTFASALSAVVTQSTGSERAGAVRELIRRPDYRQAHPTDEHIRPAFVALGAAGTDSAEVIFSHLQGSMAYVDFRTVSL